MEEFIISVDVAGKLCVGLRYDWPLQSPLPSDKLKSSDFVLDLNLELLLMFFSGFNKTMYTLGIKIKIKIVVALITELNANATASKPPPTP